ncbi:MAG: hypothetical protein JWR50_2712 [Mucilaginibacter sp.]|nr:hypothetical protein [Mucilaginibacter sp.]
MTTHRYTLQPYKTQKSRYTCPECGVLKKFTRYIDVETNLHLAEHVGKCDRETSCGYHFTPKQSFAANPDFTPVKAKQPKPQSQMFKPDYIPRKLFEKSLNRVEKNDFVEYLCSIFENSTVNELLESYYIGTAKHWPHATIFWQLDRKENVRTGKIMLYDPYTGKRIKQPYAHISWAHTLLKPQKSVGAHVLGSDNGNTLPATPKYNLQQCLFGEHLIYPGGKEIIAIVESEKTAVIAKGFMPEHIWVAAGSLEGLTLEKCRVLHGRQVMLVPDIDGYAKWEKKMQMLKAKMPATRFGMGKFLQNLPPEEQTPGMDIADWLVSGRLSENV